MAEFASPWLDWQPPETPVHDTDKTAKRSPPTPETPNQRTANTAKSPFVSSGSSTDTHIQGNPTAGPQAVTTPASAKTATSATHLANPEKSAETPIAAFVGQVREETIDTSLRVVTSSEVEMLGVLPTGSLVPKAVLPDTPSAIRIRDGGRGDYLFRNPVHPRPGFLLYRAHSAGASTAKRRSISVAGTTVRCPILTTRISPLLMRL